MRTRTKVLLTAASLGVIGVLIAIGTSAFFSATANSGTNVAATGTMSFTGGTGVYFDSGAGSGRMKPVTSLANARSGNVVVSGSSTISNTGNLTGDFNLVQTAVGGTGLGSGTGLVNPGGRPALFKKAQLCVSVSPLTDCGVYSGNLDLAPASPDDTGDSVASTAVALGTLAPGASKTYTFEVWLPNDVDTDNDYQAQTATATFQFNES